MPKVSVVTPSYNHARFLPERISSILEQTYQDFEWIIIDDCSTDGSQDVLRKLVGHDPRVTLLFHSQNLGMAATTREAIALSSGEYIYRAESDDACDKRFLERLVPVLDANPRAGLVYCSSLHMDDKGTLWGGRNQAKVDSIRPGPEVFVSLIKGSYIPGPNVVFRREANDRVGGFGAGPFTVGCDWYLWLRICLYYDIAYVSEPLGYHRSHEHNLSNTARTHDVSVMLRESYGIIIAVFDAIPEELEYLRGLKQGAIRNITTQVMAAFWGGAVTARRWSLAQDIVRGVNRYDPGATRELTWFYGILRALLWTRVYSLWSNVDRQLSSRRLALTNTIISL